MAEALAVVKVGKTECGFLKLTPTSRTAAMTGAVSAVTLKARRPSATNRMRLLGRFASAASAPLATTMANANVSRPLNLGEVAAAPARMPACAPVLLDRSRAGASAPQCAARGQAAARAPRAATPPPRRRAA